MDTMDIPPSYRLRSLYNESKPPLTDEQARDKKYSGPRMTVENNRPRVRTALAQVYSLQFLNFGGDDRHDIYGTVQVGSEGYPLTIFDRQIGKESDHDIDQKGYARLNGPILPIHGQSDIVIYPRLFKKNDSSCIFHPARLHEVVQFDLGSGPSPPRSSVADKYGLIGKWLQLGQDLDDDDELQPARDMPFNRILRDEVETTCGLAKLTYSIFRDSVEVFVRIKLLKLWSREDCQAAKRIKLLDCGQEGGQAANIYGTVCASSAMLNDPEAKSFILDRKRDESVTVRPEQFIPLHRPMTAVPMGHELELDFRIMHHDIVTGVDDDAVIASGNIKLVPRCWFKGSNDEYISESRLVEGDLGLLQLDVFWSPWWAVFMCTW